MAALQEYSERLNRTQKVFQIAQMQNGNAFNVQLEANSIEPIKTFENEGTLSEYISKLMHFSATHRPISADAARESLFAMCDILK